MDQSMGCQGSSVPEDSTEAGVRCCSGKWVGPTCLSPAVAGIGAHSQKMIWSLAELGVGTDRQEVRTLVSCSCSRAPMDSSMLTSSQLGLAGRAWCWLPGGSAGRVWGGRLPQGLPSPFPARCPWGNQVEHRPLLLGHYGVDFLEFPRL